ncbi:uncharacterized protein BX664DRAFT_330878 [Halteromyces radiatus]|uniref:uncharacterized protein n=1 Tax=Halteromyces radiatus TaxID=101107 RepID=UPI0022203B92|nr:uncharacterized protein BX664DRAFT_330878 [Halteromyces radiatus]KAI8093885.1 hypothetical protein BX664DRAFT_330878 [Halteromyces radiatus]
MAYNPFLENKVNTLQEAFPTLTPSVLENTLLEENGDMERTFDRLLAITDSTTMNTSHTRPTYKKPPTQVPIIKAKPSLQKTVREELAQWRQELQNDRDIRRTRKRISQKYPPSGACSSSYDSQNLYKDIYSIRDMVVEGSSVALKAATSLHDRLISVHNSYISGSTSSASSSSSSSSYPYYQSNNTAPNLSRPIQSHTSLSNNTRINNRNRPVPPVPVTTPSSQQQQQQQWHTNTATPRNPFDNADQSLPPPTYEARERDTLIDPVDGDRLLLRASSH